MAKSPPGIRLLRSLVHAGKRQQAMFTKLLKATTAPPKRKRPAKVSEQAMTTKAPGLAARAAIRPTARASQAIAPGKWIASTYRSPDASGLATASRLAYWLYLPDQVPDAVARRGWPLIVMLHGCHQSATQFAQGTRMNLLAEAKGYAVLYPQQSVTAQAQRCWRWFSETEHHGGGDTARLAGLIGSVCDQHAIDRQRIYACGISAGAGMAAVLALNHPELIAAIGLHSSPVFGVARSPGEAMHVMRHGAEHQAEDAIQAVLRRRANRALPDKAKPMPVMPAILIHGEDDRVVKPINQQHIARQWLLVNGLPADSAARVAAKPPGKAGKRNARDVRDYYVGPKLVLRVTRITDLGHAWSGGDPTLRFNAAAGTDASRMMLEFFRKHRR